MIWIIVILRVLAVYWQVRSVRLYARNRNLVIKETRAKWYAFAASEIRQKRGHDFLQQYFPSLFHPDLIQHDQEWLLARIATLGVYLKVLEEWGKDTRQYHQLPLNVFAYARAWEAYQTIKSIMAFRRQTNVWLLTWR